MPSQTLSLPSIPRDKSLGSHPAGKGDKSISLYQKSRLYSHAQKLLSEARSSEVHLKSRLDDAAVAKKINVLKDPAAYRSEREMNLAHFRELLRVFQSVAVSKDGKMDANQFKTAFSVVLGTGLTNEQMDVLFMKIDANTDDAIDWDEFSTFMLLRAEGQTAMREAAETRLFNADAMGRIITPHKEPINKILYLSVNKRFMTCSRDGTVCYWSEKLKLQRCYDKIGSKRIQAPLKKNGFSPAPPRVFVYDYTTMETQVRLDLHDCVALTLDEWQNVENPDSDQTTLIMGTDSGYIMMLTFLSSLLFSSTGKKKDDPPPVININSTRILKTYGATLSKRKAHHDWTLKVKYYRELRSIVSCSPDSRNSVVMATEDGKGRWSYVSSSVYRGVNTFAFSKFPIALVTGGTDRQLRIWNPYRMQNPIVALRGHSSPIIDISINPLNGQIISLSVDKQIKVWDIRKQQCLQTLFDHIEHRPEDALMVVFFSKYHARLIAASTIMETYKLKEAPARGAESPGEHDILGQPIPPAAAPSQQLVKSHDNPIRAALYNQNFKQVVSGCDAGVVNVWDIFTGTKTFQFSGIHGKSETTAMAFDSVGRRLVTGGRDGTIRTWNFNNGQQLQELVKTDDAEVTSIAYLDTRDSKFFVVTGWNRKIMLFPDSPTAMRVYASSVWPNEANPTALHQDDVLSLACYPPHLLATSSYDGEIVICNLQSGHVLHRLRAPDHEEENSNRSIDKVVFLTDRNTLTDASLVSSGGDGIIRWWNAEQGFLSWETDGTHGRGEGIYAMRANAGGTMLVTGDAFGWVTCWDISETCIDEDARGMESYVMPELITFRAHRRCIVSIDLVEGLDSVVTASTDGCVRLFTIKGEYVGTFGQLNSWNISNPNTYIHPAMPPDVEAALQEEGADQEAVERLKAVAKKMTGFAKNRRVSKSVSHVKPGGGGLPSIGGALGAGQPKVVRVPPLARAPSKVTDLRIRTPKQGDDEKLPSPIRQQVARTPPKTADLLRRNYNTWYTNSLFAKEEFHRHFPQHQKLSVLPIDDILPSASDTDRGEKLERAANVGHGLRIYNRLRPYELTDISQLSQSPIAMGIVKSRNVV
ncbi:hypothetical protein HDV00_001526 [Rhizophlyctis rosea]|nr:hypothetical protein HDV00_001526 [Rhizophlyctis rosea]